MEWMIDEPITLLGDAHRVYSQAAGSQHVPATTTVPWKRTDISADNGIFSRLP